MCRDFTEESPALSLAIGAEGQQGDSSPLPKKLLDYLEHIQPCGGRAQRVLSSELRAQRWRSLRP